MTKKDALLLKVDDNVYDRWFPDYGQGVVVEAKKTIFTIRFENVKENNGMVRYDLAHMKFIEFGEIQK